MRRALALVLLLLAAMPALAVEPGEMLKDPALEARAREIGQALRCVVCQNQSIDDLQAAVAHDMRLAVRQRLVAGDSDQQVLAYMVARYGDYVLLEPPFKARTLALWLGPPALILVAAMALLAAAFRRRAPAAPQALNEAEQRRLHVILGEAKDPSPSPRDGG